MLNSIEQKFEISIDDRVYENVFQFLERTTLAVCDDKNLMKIRV